MIIVLNFPINKNSQKNPHRKTESEGKKLKGFEKQGLYWTKKPYRKTESQGKKLKGFEKQRQSYRAPETLFLIGNSPPDCWTEPSELQPSPWNLCLKNSPFIPSFRTLNRLPPGLFSRGRNRSNQRIKPWDWTKTIRCDLCGRQKSLSPD